MAEVHPSPSFRRSATGIGSADPKAIIVDEYVPKHQRFNLCPVQAIGGNPVDQLLFSVAKKLSIRALPYQCGHADQAPRQAPSA